MGRVSILFRWGIWLKSTKELLRLESAAERRQVLGELSSTRGRPWFLILDCAWLAITIATAFWIREPVVLLPCLGVVAGSFGWFVLYASFRRHATQRRLREVLQARGVMVCINCGYDLRGQFAEPVCPECAWAFDRRLLGRAPPAAGSTQGG